MLVVQGLSGAITMITGRKHCHPSNDADEEENLRWAFLEEGRAVQWSCAGCSHLNAETAERCEVCCRESARARTSSGVRSEGSGPVLERIVVEGSWMNWEISSCHPASESSEDLKDTGDVAKPVYLEDDGVAAHRAACALAARTCVVGSFVEVLCDDDMWHCARVLGLRGVHVDVIFQARGIMATRETLVYPADAEYVRPAKASNAASHKEDRSRTSTESTNIASDGEEESEYDEYESGYDDYGECDDSDEEASNIGDAEVSGVDSSNERHSETLAFEDEEPEEIDAGCMADDECSSEQADEDESDDELPTNFAAPDAKFVPCGVSCAGSSASTHSGEISSDNGVCTSDDP